MYKKIFVYIGLLVLLIGVLLPTYLFLVQPNVGPDFKIYLGQSENQIPEIDWKDITNGNLSRSLYRAHKNNKLLPIVNGVMPISTFRHPNPSFYENYGFGYIELFFEEVKTGKYLPLDTRPYHSIAIYSTDIDGEKYFVLIQRWLNDDETVSFVPIITNNIETIEGFIKNNSDKFPSVIVSINNSYTCEGIVGAGTKYCKWYFENQKEYDKIRLDWLTDNKVPTKFAKYPVLITRSLLKI